MQRQQNRAMQVRRDAAMRIGIIGKGNVAGCLGPLWGSKGHEIVYGVKDPTHPEVSRLVGISGREARAVALTDLSRLVDVILLSVRWRDVREVISALGNIDGKLLIDCITPIEPGKKELLFGHTTSASEEIAAMAPGASVVKAFDTAGIKTIQNPCYGKDRATVFICGNDLDAKGTAGLLAKELGFDVCDAGELKIARYLEPLAMLWVHLALVQGLGGDIGFKLLRRSAKD
jgi:predicted dinucleotide-binding enzyme